MAWRVPATPSRYPEGHTNTCIQHANYVAERCTPRYYRILAFRWSARWSVVSLVSTTWVWVHVGETPRASHDVSSLCQ